jgi:molybdate transport system regulatory protein
MILAERNRFDGRIISVKLGSLVAKVIVQIGDNEIESIVTLQSADEMKLKPGDPITVVIRSTDVMLSRNATAGA